MDGTVTKPWESKTLWVNLIGVAALFIQSHSSYVVSPEIQAYALLAVNAALRLITKDPIAWN